MFIVDAKFCSHLRLVLDVIFNVNHRRVQLDLGGLILQIGRQIFLHHPRRLVDLTPDFSLDKAIFEVEAVNAADYKWFDIIPIADDVSNSDETNQYIMVNAPFFF